MRNAKVRKDNKLGIQGVSYNRQYKKYVSVYCEGPKVIFLGYHKLLKNAVKARKIYEKERI